MLKEDKKSFALEEGDSPVGGRKRNLGAGADPDRHVSLSDFGATSVSGSCFIPNGVHGIKGFFIFFFFFLCR